MSNIDTAILAVAIGTILTAGIYLPERWHLWKTARGFQRALESGRVRDHRVQSDRVVEFEEFEDEGACYAFEIDEGRFLFVTGQDFYESDTFPNSDFSIIDIDIDIDDRSGLPFYFYVDIRGKKLSPSRVIPAKVKWDLPLAEHMEIIEGTVDTIEESLRKKEGD